MTDSETRKLADLALSRNADDVVTMLQSVVSKQAERVETRIEDEKFADKGFDPDIDKMLNNLFRNGTTLAKLLNPALGRPLVQINGNITPSAQVAQADPRALASTVIAELEASGVKREDMTQEMIEEYMRSKYAPKQIEAIDAEVEGD